MKYIRKIDENFNIELSKDVLLELEKFIQDKLTTSDIDSKVWITSETWNTSGATLLEVLESEEITNNLNGLKSLHLYYDNQSCNEHINVIIINSIGSITIRIDSTSETFVMGVHEIIKQYILQNFIKNREILSQEEANNVNENKKAHSKINEPLLKYIKAIALTVEDLKTIENLMLQDLDDNAKYEIKVKSTDKHLKKNPSLQEYTFSSVAELRQDESGIVENSDNYNFTFQLKKEDVNIELFLSHEFPYNSTNLRTSGENQTLYYGKFLLLNKFIKCKEPWYKIFHTIFFSIEYYIFIYSFVSVSILWFLKKIFEAKFEWKIIALNTLLILLTFLAIKAFPKFKIINKSNPKCWWQNSTYQFFITCLLSIIPISIEIVRWIIR